LGSPRSYSSFACLAARTVSGRRAPAAIELVGSARHVLASGIKLEANVKARLYRRPV
jgi:hypothetical protein